MELMPGKAITLFARNRMAKASGVYLDNHTYR